MESTEYYKNELMQQPVTKRILLELEAQPGLTRAELLKITEFSLATVYGKYVPRMIEYGIIIETKGTTGTRTLKVAKTEIKEVKK